MKNKEIIELLEKIIAELKNRNNIKPKSTEERIEKLEEEIEQLKHPPMFINPYMKEIDYPNPITHPNYTCGRTSTINSEEINDLGYKSINK